ncbi:uncharacterized protein LOC132760259 [Ruditapes philippinarum]|uniref:uncharacterized protein LOC132760259 n=1 Tax=Ruditapes philippinarum TaxID=129788 RepID=UPI00295AE701|nr:uncharacterized protein LOC132760259 [Ruditapes philippinarum]
MLGILLLLASSLALATTLEFTDCATDKTATLLTVRSLDISPAVIPFPGQIQISTYISINHPITHFFVDTVLEIQTLGVWTKIPCIGSTSIGSCQNFDFRTLLENMHNGTSVISNSFGQQLSAILLKALGYKARFPLYPKDVIICHEPLTLNVPTGILKLIFQNGRTYRVTISVKDDPTIRSNLGCIQFKFQLAQKVDPYLVG